MTFLSIQCEHGDIIYSLDQDGYTMHPNATEAEKDNMIRCLSNALRDFHLAVQSSPSGMAVEIGRLKQRIAELEQERSGA